jgi:glycine/D-amino acid oxidase-like deaminating enzyme
VEEKEKVVAHTPHGQVRARKVALATNGWFSQEGLTSSKK